MKTLSSSLAALFSFICHSINVFSVVDSNAADFTVVDFRESSIAVKPAEANQSELEHQPDGSLLITSENFWTIHYQVENLNLPTEEWPQEAQLAVEMRGSISDLNPVLRVVLFTQDWSQSKEFRIPIAELDHSEFKVFFSNEKFSDAPASDEGNLMELGQSVGNLYFNFQAEGNQRWTIELSRIFLKTSGT